MDNYDIVFNILLHTDHQVIYNVAMLSKLIVKILTSKTFWIQKFQYDDIPIKLDDTIDYLTQYSNYYQCRTRAKNIIKVSQLEQKLDRNIETIYKNKGIIRIEFEQPYKGTNLLLPEEILIQIAETLEDKNAAFRPEKIIFTYINNRYRSEVTILEKMKDDIFDTYRESNTKTILSIDKTVDILTTILYDGHVNVMDDLRISYFLDSRFLTDRVEYSFRDMIMFRRIGLLEMLK